MPSSDRPVLYSVEDTVAVITLDSPDTGNLINPAFVAAFREVCESIADDPAVRVVLVRSALSDFCVGGRPMTAPYLADSDLANVRVAAHLGQLKQPVIAALTGAVIDQGLELALAADIRIASPDTHLAMRQVTKGAFPFDGGTQRLTRISGPALATEMLLTGKELTAEEAHISGLISEIVPDSGGRSLELALDIAQRGSLASEYTKKAILAAGDETFEKGAHLEAEFSFLLHGEEEREEGLAAFRAGRQPRMPGAPRTSGTAGTPALDQSGHRSPTGT